MSVEEIIVLFKPFCFHHYHR